LTTLPTFRVDDEVWEWLKGHARPLEDTPNSVLRRIAGLDSEPGDLELDEGGTAASPMRLARPKGPAKGGSNVISNYARNLAKSWRVNVEHGLYHKDGRFFMHLLRFPGALFDSHGYVVFKSEEEYRRNPYLRHYATRLHVPKGIASIPGYVNVG
jgi:hypothetical protein